MVDPFVDRPQEHIRVDPYGVMVGLTDKGRSTIRDVGLNRPSLVQPRLYAYEEAMAAARSGDETRMSNQLLPERAYALTRWWAIQDVLGD